MGLEGRRRLQFGFLALGVILRLGRFALNSPLWWNEAFVAVNVFQRDYLGLSRPLAYGQVAPIGFLWAERAVVELLGRAEWTLRLLPLAASIAGLLVFGRLASRLVPGAAGTIAVAVLAVSYHPIRLGAEAKPYASDLLIAAGLLVLWERAARDRGRRAGIVLAAAAAIAPALSYPSAFVAGGIGLALLARRERPFLAIGYNLALVSGFVANYALHAGVQAAATSAGMRAYWAAAFPPLPDPAATLGWLARTHAGPLLAYPGGDGGYGLGLLGAALVGLGAWRLRGRRELLIALLSPFVLTLLAATLGRHPYGGHPRMMQHLAPSTCLLAGAGMAGLLARVRGPARRRRLVILGAAGLASAGIIPLMLDLPRPYRSEVEHEAREFARRFWPEARRGAELTCPRLDDDPPALESPDLDFALFVANRAIHDPAWGRPVDRGAVGAGHPLRVVTYRSPRDPAGGRGSPSTGRVRLARRTWEIGGRVGPRAVVEVEDFLPAERSVRPSSGLDVGAGVSSVR